MDIAIIGAGNVGRALAASTVDAGHTVTISSHDPSDAEQVASDVGARAAPDNGYAVEDADLVIMAVPYNELSAVADEWGSRLQGKVVWM